MFAAIVGQSWAVASHPYNLEINGIDLIAFLNWPSLRIEMAGPGSNGSMTFTLEDKDSSIPTVNEWDEVRFIEWAAPTFPIQFGGFVQSVKYVTWAAAGRSIQVTCVGYGILLDKKVVPSFIVEGFSLFDVVVSMVNRHGGLVGGVTGALGDINATIAGANTDIVNFFSPVAPVANSILRAALEYLAANTIHQHSVTGALTPASQTYWVDACRRLNWVPNVASDEFNSVKRFQYTLNQLPGLTIDETGTFIVDELDYEREDTDRVTSAYVVGGAAPGTGYFRAPPIERAGDLEAIVTASDSLVEGDIATKGGAAVQQTTSATARGEATIGSNTPLDIFPGRNIEVTSPRATLNGEDWRITSTVIAFSSSTYREYTVGFGGNIPQRSAARLTGRFRRR